MSVKLLAHTIGIDKTESNNGYPGKPVTETLTNGFFTVDKKWTVKYWNKAAEKILGVQAKDIVGTNLWEKFAGVIPLEFYKVYQQAFQQETPVHFKEYWVEKEAWFDIITYHCEGTLSVSFKSSNHPQSEYPENSVQRLKTLTELYRFVTEITNDCLWEWDLKCREIFWIDGGHKRVLGYQIENALIPQSFWESCIHPDDRVRLLTRLNKIIAEGTDSLWEDEYRYKKANGDYIYVQDRGHIIYDGDKKPSRMIGATQDITERVLLENKLGGERLTRQKEITNAVLTAQENERASIGKELHENINQILAVAKLYLQMGKKYEKNREMYLKKSCDFIGNVIEEIRRISKTLATPGSNYMGLFDSIKAIVEDQIAIHPIKIEFQGNGIDDEALDEKLQVTIFRIVQEQLNNILKHSQATRSTINISRHANEIILLISDNGVGCDILKEKNGVGLINIRSRAELFHGSVTIKTKPGEGYELKIVLSLNADKNKPEVLRAMQNYD